MPPRLRGPKLPAFVSQIVPDAATETATQPGRVLMPGVADGRELAIRTVPIAGLNSSVNLLPDSPIYTTQKRWHGIDVYISTPTNIGASNFLNVQIFANNQGVRSLVATGKTAGTADQGVRIAASRAIADSFEVWVSQRSAAGVPATAKVQLIVVASDEADAGESDSFLGAMSMNFSSDSVYSLGIQLSMSAAPFPVELLALEAVNNSGVLRYIQVFNSAVAAGTPRHVFAIDIGKTMWIDTQVLRMRRFDVGVLIAPSTTPLVNTNPGDGLTGLNAWVR